MNASGSEQIESMIHDPFNLRHLLPPFLASDGDGDEGGDGGDGGEGSDDKGKGGSDDKDDKGSSSSGGDSDKDKDANEDGGDDKQLKSREAAKYRTERNAERERAEKAEKALEERERKERSDLQNAEKDRDTFKTQAETLAEENTSLKVKVALFESGALNDFVDPSDAGRYLNFGDFVDKDGEVKAKDLKDEIKRLKTEKAYLFAASDSDEDDKDDDKIPSGSKPKSKKNKDETTRDQLIEKFPALRR